MNKDITRVQETIRKLRAVMTAVSDIAYDRIVFKPEDVYAEYLLELIDVACEYAEKADSELEHIEKKTNGFVA